MKTNMTTWLRGAGTGLAFGTLALLAGGCSFHKNVAYETAPQSAPPPAPAVVGAYEYDYYPSANVYYDPAGNMYYWYHDGRWHSGHRLPSRYVLRDLPHERYRYNTPTPWIEHEHGYGE